MISQKTERSSKERQVGGRTRRYPRRERAARQKGMEKKKKGECHVIKTTKNLGREDSGLPQAT